MKKKMMNPAAVFLLLLFLWGFTGCATTSGFGAEGEENYPEMIPASEDIDEWGGADYYENGGDNSHSRYWKHPDFYRLVSDDQLTLIEGFRTFHQTSEWSCGNATALLVLHHLGVESYSEWDIAVAMGSSTDLDDPEAEPGSADNYYEFGTSVAQMARFFGNIPEIRIVESSFRDTYNPEDLIAMDNEDYTPASRGNLPESISAMALYASENDDATEAWVEDAADSWFVRWLKGHLEASRPIMVEWADWDGHWQAIIGYDNNGTPGIGDDVLIFADPYDTSDHWQDGYYFYPLERWFYMWNDRNVAPKPYQLQPYIIVEKK